MENTQWIRYVLELAERNKNNNGKPFGAIIVKSGSIVAEGVNDVLATHDPTAHAELQAISRASKILETDDLSECELYASNEPCPMCLSAIYLANINKVYFSVPMEGNPLAVHAQHIYDQVGKPNKERTIKMVRLTDNI